MGYTGVGDYALTANYQYVGAGAGQFSAVPIPASGCSCWWSLCCLWLLVIPFLCLAGYTTTTTTTSTTTFFVPTPSPPLDVPTPPPTPQGPPGTCRVYGDPHIQQFDGGHVSFYSQGEYWLVKSDTVWIQARYAPTPVTNGLGVTKEIAVGGPFLECDGKSNVLRISALAASWNGQPIIPNFPDQFFNPCPAVEVVTDASGQVMQKGRGGKPMHVVHVRLPRSVTLEINRWNEPGEGDYINVAIGMPPQPGQDGHCGTFNGNQEDDTRAMIRARLGTTGVPPEDLLFNTKTPVTAPNRPDLNDCPREKTEHARSLCAARDPKGMPSSECMIDVCFGGDAFADEGAYD